MKASNETKAIGNVNVGGCCRGSSSGGGCGVKVVHVTSKNGCCGSKSVEASSRDCAEETLNCILDRARDVEAKDDCCARGGCGANGGGGVLGKTVDATDCCGKPISHHEEFSSRDCAEETLDRILDRARDAEAKNDCSARGGCRANGGGTVHGKKT